MRRESVPRLTSLCISIQACSICIHPAMIRVFVFDSAFRWPPPVLLQFHRLTLLISRHRGFPSALTFPYRPKKIEVEEHNLGQILMSDRVKNTSYEVWERPPPLLLCIYSLGEKIRERLG